MNLTHISEKNMAQQVLPDIKDEVRHIIDCMINTINITDNDNHCYSGTVELLNSANKNSIKYNQKQKFVHFSSPLNTYQEYSLSESTNSIFSTQELLEDVDDGCNNNLSFEENIVYERDDFCKSKNCHNTNELNDRLILNGIFTVQLENNLVSAENNTNCLNNREKNISYNKDSQLEDTSKSAEVETYHCIKSDAQVLDQDVNKPSLEQGNDYVPRMEIIAVSPEVQVASRDINSHIKEIDAQENLCNDNTQQVDVDSQFNSIPEVSTHSTISQIFNVQMTPVNQETTNKNVPPGVAIVPETSKDSLTVDCLVKTGIAKHLEVQENSEITLNSDVKLTSGFQVHVTKDKQAQSNLPVASDFSAISEAPVIIDVALMKEASVTSTTQVAMSSDIPVYTDIQITSDFPGTLEGQVTCNVPATYDVRVASDAELTTEVDVITDATKTSVVPTTAKLPVPANQKTKDINSEIQTTPNVQIISDAAIMHEVTVDYKTHEFLDDSSAPDYSVSLEGEVMSPIPVSADNKISSTDVAETSEEYPNCTITNTREADVQIEKVYPSSIKPLLYEDKTFISTPVVPMFSKALVALDAALISEVPTTSSEAQLHFEEHSPLTFPTISEVSVASNVSPGNKKNINIHAIEKSIDVQVKDENSFSNSRNLDEISDSEENSVCVAARRTANIEMSQISHMVDEHTNIECDLERKIISGKPSSADLKNLILGIPFITSELPNDIIQDQHGHVASIADVKHITGLVYGNDISEIPRTKNKSERQTCERVFANIFSTDKISSNISIASCREKSECLDMRYNEEFGVNLVVKSVLENMCSFVSKHHLGQRKDKIQDNNETAQEKYDFVIRNIDGKSDNSVEYTCDRMKENEMVDYFEKVPLDASQDSIPQFITASQLYNSQDSEKISELEEEQEECSEICAVNTHKRKMECKEGQFADIVPEKILCLAQNMRQPDEQTVPDIDSQSVKLKNTFGSENDEKSEKDQEREEKMYCCDMEVCTGKGSMLCQSIEQFKQSQTVLAESEENSLQEQQIDKLEEVKILQSKYEKDQKSSFPWKLKDTSELGNQVVPDNTCYDPGLSKYYPVPVCGKVRRIGLSRKGRVKTLHPAFRRPES